MLPAEWSNKTAVENQQDILFSPEIGEPDGLSLEILQAEVRGGRVQGHFWHGKISPEAINERG